MIVTLVAPVASYGAELRFGESPSVGSGERITDDVYLTGGSVTSNGNIFGDLVAGGGNVIVSGTVSADALVGGGNVTILSSIGDDLRAGGGSVVIQGKIGGDLIAGGGNLSIGGPGIGGDLVVGAGTLRLDAPVSGSAHIGGGEVYLNSPITGDVIIKADKVTLGSGARISGNLTYTAKEALTQEEGATVLGTIDFKEKVGQRGSPAKAVTLISILIFGKFLILLVSALVLGLVFRRFSMETITKATERPLLELGRGLVAFAALPVLSVLVLITVIGIPLGILGLISFVALLIVMWIMAPVLVGSVVYRYFSKRGLEVSWKTIVLGVIIFSLIGLIPFIGTLAKVLIMLLSLGAVVAIKLQVAKLWR